MIPTIERDDRGYWVRCLGPDGKPYRVGPMSKGEAAHFLVTLQWGR